MLYRPQTLHENAYPSAYTRHYTAPGSLLRCVPLWTVLTRSNYRQSYDQDYVCRLAVDMAENGYRQSDPMRVYENGDGSYTVIDGNTRHKAAMLASVYTVSDHKPLLPVWILIEAKPSDSDFVLRQMIANEDNRQPDMISQAIGYKALLDSGKTLPELCTALRHTPDYITCRVALLNLIPELRDMAAKNHLPIRIGTLIAQLTPEYQWAAKNAYLAAKNPTYETFKPAIDDLLTKQNQQTLFDLPLLTGEAVALIENERQETVKQKQTREALEKKCAALETMLAQERAHHTAEREAIKREFQRRVQAAAQALAQELTQ